MFLQQTDLALGENAALGGRLLFQPQQPVNAQRETVQRALDVRHCELNALYWALTPPGNSPAI
jgi:hypothetical protein